MARRLGRTLAIAATAMATAMALVACSQEPVSTRAAAETATSSSADEQETAIFAGGCFWCMEADFDKVDGVLATTSGYTGGTAVDPTYKEVSAGDTGHAEAVRVIYDPSKVTYPQLLEVFWHNVDPVDAGGQFCDRGDEYRAAIFVDGDQQRRLAEQSKQALVDSERFEEPIVTEIVAAGTFYPAEDYHQDYHDKNPIRYGYYRRGCGRDARLAELWGEPTTH